MPARMAPCRRRSCPFELSSLAFHQKPSHATKATTILCYHSTSYASSRRHHKDPYRVLGVSRDSPYIVIKKKFLELALKFHPDTSDKETSEKFIHIRNAFESIRKKATYHEKGQSDPNHDADLAWTEDQFLAWFHEQTGVKLSSAQRRELVRLHRSRVPGGYYGGQMWDLARRVVQEQDAFFRKMKDDPPPPPAPKDSSINIRRRRRR